MKNKELAFQIRNKFLYSLFNWEFWPWEIIYFPIMIYGLWLSIKAKTLFFFFNVNPGIESGGLLIESKKEILDLIPDRLKPKTLFFKFPASIDEVLSKISENRIYFPLIAKPDYGERGWMVEKIEDREELKKYINAIQVNFIVQEFIDMPIELGIFYYRYPGFSKGKISSIVWKKLLQVEGNGLSTVRKLILNNPRARLHLKAIEKRHPGLMNLVPGKFEQIELIPIGNHCRGTTFLNANDLIDEKLDNVINDFASKIPGFFYGRFDIRCSSINKLKFGESFKILELNGGKSEPAHIYHPGSSILNAYKVLFYHWRILYEIAILNHQYGHPYPSLRKGWQTWKKYKYYKRIRKSCGLM